MRQIHNLIQGSPEWHAHRNTPGIFNGSELAAIMGLSSYKTRAALLREKATGITEEVDAAKQKRFDDGHRYEALARPLAEGIIDDDLSAMVMSDEIDGVLLSVSLDGITQCKGTTFEHKGLNIVLSDALDAGCLPDEYHPQCEAGLMVSGATRCLFMASKWDIDDNLIDKKHYWYESRPELRPRIIAACKQFSEDLANYEHVETAPAAVAAPIESLPALAVAVSGSISLSHNLERFGKRLTEFVAGLNAKPETDQDFANLDAAVKVLKEAEGALDSAEKNALAQTTTIADMCNLVEMYRKVARDNRLMFEKIVKQEKVNRKAAIISQASTALAAHITGLNNRLGASYMPAMSGGFAEAIAGLKSLDSMRDKVATALANAKIEANEIADRIEKNHKALLIGTENDTSHLFPDFSQVCTKALDDFAALHAMRIQQEEARKQAEREKIRQEEADRITRENARADLQTKAQAANDQRVKPADTAQAQATPEQKQAVVIEHQDDIAEFMAGREWGKDAGKIRAALVEFVKFQASKNLAVAA